MMAVHAKHLVANSVFGGKRFGHPI
jgi:hypothetical protein